MKQLSCQNAEFIRSAVSTDDFPGSSLPHIVFAGKSNVGKSSVLNKILNRKNFARVGSSPGKTTHINFFMIDKRAFFVDLPGYGYAKVSKAERQRWGKLIEEYFATDSMSFGVFIVDARHKPTADDITMSQWFLDSQVPFCVVANKADKLKEREITPSITRISETFGIPEERIISFSALKGTGVERLIREINGAVSAFDG